MTLGKNNYESLAALLIFFYLAQITVGRVFVQTLTSVTMLPWHKDIFIKMSL